jgi:hypothetical protein
MGQITQELMDELTEASSNRNMAREEFTSLLQRSAAALDMMASDIASISGMQISVPTAERWLAGTAVPHRVGRPSVFCVLYKVAAKQAYPD